ncbi:ferritin-like protein [Actinomadura sp. 3N508]|uniref:ferritin-like protein n=1 Tax=Actinomadura sp. 3N508 TaxID=3375153 RepID=UPI0037B6D786
MTAGSTASTSGGRIVQAHELKFEPPASLDQLRTYLQYALQVEHITIPPYLTAMYTLRPGTNRSAFYVIRSVVLEEMLHMTLVSNLLNAVGGTPCVAHPEFVLKYPATLPLSAGNIPVPLRHFSREALKTFLRIEQPQSFSGPPDPRGWTSIGQFYDYIRRGLIGLIRDLGEARVFTGHPGRQVGPEDFYNSGGEVFKVTGRDSALLALRVVSEQGEGLGDSIWDSDDQIFGEERQVAHYFRFNEIAEGRLYGPHDLPKDRPSGPPMNVTWEDVYRIDGGSTVAEYGRFPDKSVYHHAKAFNDAYAGMLAFLQEGFTGSPRDIAHAIPVMLELRDRSQALYRNPHPDPRKAAEGLSASATFEIDQDTIDRAVAHAAARIEAAGLSAGEPIDLSALTAPRPS